MKNLVFDIDDTLYDQIQPFRRAYEEMFPQWDHISIVDLFREREHYSNVGLRKVVEGTFTVPQMNIYRMIKAMETFGIHLSEEQAEAFQAAYKKYQKELYLTEEMQSLLNDLVFVYGADFSQHVAILSNGPSDHQWGKVQALKLLKWFYADRVFISGDTGYIKPDVRAFEHVKSQMRFDDEEIWYIGDNQVNDMAGAKAAGWKTIWMNRDGKQECECFPDIEVHSEEELHELLLELCNA